MLKRTGVAALAVSLAWFASLAPAAAQQQAPIGHRQPTASAVSADDSFRGDAGLDAQPQPRPSKKGARTRRARTEMEVIMKTPNICSNCNE